MGLMEDRQIKTATRMGERTLRRRQPCKPLCSRVRGSLTFDLDICSVGISIHLERPPSLSFTLRMVKSQDMQSSVKQAPFARENSINDEFDSLETLQAGSAPIVKLSCCPNLDISDAVALTDFLRQDLQCDELDKIADKLWVLSTPSSSNIRPLHKQRVLGREIVVTEECRLHLLWVADRIFIKPLPRYLLSWVFWDRYLTSDDSCLGKARNDLYSTALGLLRSYHHLIRHPCDFWLAQQEHLSLLPRQITWEQFCRISASIANIEDSRVSGRYLYGEIRLSRLNMYAPVLFRTFIYEQVHGQFAERFSRLFAPVLFAFALLATCLSAMQGALSGRTLPQSSPAGTLQPFFVWFSIVAVFCTLGIGIAFVLLWSWMVFDEQTFSYRTYKRRLSKLSPSVV